MDIKKILLPVALVLVFGGYIVYARFFSSSTTQTPIINNDQNSPSQDTTNSNQNQNNPPPQTGYKNGKYTGDIANTVYGDIQVQAIISGGKITDIQLLAYPNHVGHSVEVSDMSLPILKSEAIQVQSANVNVVSGATQTSEGFSQSLASALSKAV
jgi:uncharacterized protein with FMN-binding domain